MLERDIDLWDLLWAVVDKWKIIIVLAILGAMLAIGIDVVQGEKSSTSNKDLLGDIQIDATNELYEKGQEVYDNMAEYVYVSPVMKWNANSIYTNLITCSFEEEYAQNYVETVVTNVIESEQSKKKISEILDISTEESKYISDYYGFNIDQDTQEHTSSNCIKQIAINIFAETENENNELTQLLQSELMANKSLKIDNIIVGKMSYGYQKYVEDKQRLYITKTNTLRKNVKEFGDVKSGGSDVAEHNNVGEQNRISINKKRVILFSAALVMLCMAIIVLQYIFSQKIHSDDLVKLEKKFGFYYRVKDSKYKSLVEKVRYQRKTMHSIPASVEIVNSYICGNQDELNELLVIGEWTDLELFAEQLQKISQNIDVKCAKNLIDTSDAISQAKKCRNIILVVENEISIYNEVIKTIDFCAKLEINILGIIVAF